MKALLAKKSEVRESSHEAAAWGGISGDWRPLHGSFVGPGLSIEWHEFHLSEDLDWARSFHPNSLEICLNFSGQAELGRGGEEYRIGANQLAVYCHQESELRAVRFSGSLHRFLTVEIAPEFLSRHFGTMIERLKLPVKEFMRGNASELLEVLPMPAAMLSARTHFLQPPVAAGARDTWYLGRVLEILAQTIFRIEDPKELFCARYQRTNRERVELVRYLLERDLENPPSLEMLATEVGCSPCYLSRIFTQDNGASIPKFLRMKRIERAAELLRSRAMNVTEAAMAVGYSSLSAFNRAFVEQLGCCPGLYPNVPLVAHYD